jgi:hypothetical protein
MVYIWASKWDRLDIFYFRKVTNANFMQLSHLTNYNGSNPQKPNRRMATNFQDNIVSILDGLIAMKANSLLKKIINAF